MTAGGLVASADGDSWVLPGEGGVPGPCLNRLASMSHMRGVRSCLVGW